MESISDEILATIANGPDGAVAIIAKELAEFRSHAAQIMNMHGGLIKVIGLAVACTGIVSEMNTPAALAGDYETVIQAAALAWQSQKALYPGRPSDALLGIQATAKHYGITVEIIPTGGNEFVH